VIGYLRGVVRLKTESYVMLETNGVGYEVFVPGSAMSRLPEPNHQAELYIHFDVQEKSQEMFGFSTVTERDLFRVLISVSGVGPRTALGILSELNVSDLVTAVQLDDHRVLERVPKIGKKTAARLIIELRDKIEQFPVEPSDEGDYREAHSDLVHEASAALVELGFSIREARRAAAIAAKDSQGVEEIIRNALVSLSVIC